MNPENMEIAEMEKINDRSFNLINPYGRYFVTLFLTGEYRGDNFPDTYVESHFAVGEISVAEFIGLAENVVLDIYNDYWKAMRKKNSNTYRLLVKVLNLGSSESSPTSDLNYARSIKEIIQKDSYHNDNTNKVLNAVEKFSERITDRGSQSDINIWADCLRLVSNIRTTLAYDSLISIYPDNVMIKREYVAWHNLIEAMVYYQDYLYSAETYLAVPEEKNTIIRRWLDYRRESIEKDGDIISGKLVYAIHSSRADTIKSEEDFNELFTHFHRYDKPIIIIQCGMKSSSPLMNGYTQGIK